MGRKRKKTETVGGKQCPYCGKKGFKSQAAVNSHIKTVHPNMEEGQEPNQILQAQMPLMEPGYGQMQCPFCKSHTVVFVKDDGTIASSSELPKPPSSSEGGLRNPIKRGAHPIVIRERFKMRRREDGSWKNTLVMMGTHGRTAPETPWYEPGIEEIWLLNDSHSIDYVKPHVDAGKVDRWWQLHHRWRFTRRQTRLAEDHWTWLQESNIPRIVMQRQYADVPNSEGFPLREISEMFLDDNLGRGAGYVHTYFTNTFSYMFAQALYEKVKGIKDWERIELYGCELEQLETEYFRQRPGLEFWFGLCVAHDIEIYVPNSCFMLYAQDVAANQFGQQQMVQYPGYMAYGFQSPSLEEVKERNKIAAEHGMQQEPIGVDPIEENVMGSWEDYFPRFDVMMDEGIERMKKAHAELTIKEDMATLNEWFDRFDE